ncbi:MAG: hypothetical protein AB7X49_15410, partial [Geminicoccaceae bacterium]
HWIAVAGIAVPLLLGLATLVWRTPSDPAIPSIAVLPLENRSGDTRLGRLADGMIENVIGDLSGLGWDVMARGTTFAYRNAARDPRRIGAELGVAYVVDGSLEGDGRRLLANVALVDAASGRQLWSERYDRPLEDLFAVQDELSLQIVTSLSDRVWRDQLREAQQKPPRNLEAFDLRLLADEELYQQNAAANAEAVKIIEHAIELDPTSSNGYAMLAYAHRQQVENLWAPHDQAMEDWLQAAVRAVELEPSNSWARYALAQRYLYGNDQRRWWAEVQRILELAPRDVRLMSELGAVDLPIGGQTDRGVALVERAVRLDPANPEAYYWRQRNVYFNAGRFEEAAQAAEAIDDDGYWPRYWNTLIYAELGSAALQRWRALLLESEPDFSAERLLWRTGDFLMPEAKRERDRFFDAVAKASLPRCATPEQLLQEPSMRRLPECDIKRTQQSAASP